MIMETQRMIVIMVLINFTMGQTKIDFDNMKAMMEDINEHLVKTEAELAITKDKLAVTKEDLVITNDKLAATNDALPIAITDQP